MSIPIEKTKKDLRKTTNIIRIKSPALWTGPRPTSFTSSTSSSPRVKTVAIQVPTKEAVGDQPEIKKKKKPKWWQFWKRITWGS